MIIKLNFNQSILGLLLLAITTPSYSDVIDDATLIVKGRVTKGTCSFILPEQVVKFPQAILLHEIAEIGENSENKIPFSVDFSCKDFTNDTPNLEIAIKAGTGTQIISNNKISPTSNTTNASFALYDCKNNSCQLVNFNSGKGAVHIDAGNGTYSKDFEVEIVKRSTSTVTAGKLTAILDFTLIQP